MTWTKERTGFIIQFTELESGHLWTLHIPPGASLAWQSDFVSFDLDAIEEGVRHAAPPGAKGACVMLRPGAAYVTGYYI